MSKTSGCFTASSIIAHVIFNLLSFGGLLYSADADRDVDADLVGW